MPPTRMKPAESFLCLDSITDFTYESSIQSLMICCELRLERNAQLQPRAKRVGLKAVVSPFSV